MTTADLQMTVFVADPAFAGPVPKAAHISVFTPKTAKGFNVGEPWLNLFVISAATDLGPVAQLVHEASSVHKLRALFVRTEFDSAWSLPLLDRAGIRTLRNTIVHRSGDIPARVLRAWAWGAQHELIADAVATDDHLLVRDCALKTFELDFSQIPVLSKLAGASRSEFSIDPDGSYLHWPKEDIHLSLDEIRYALEPDFRTEIQWRRLTSQERFGAAVAELRRRAGLRQSDLPSLSTKQVSRIETGKVLPRLDTISKLASVHNMTVEEYLNELASRMRAG